MLNEIVKTETNTSIAVQDVDPFAAFADSIAPKYILGKLLKFSKGDYFAGEASEIVPVGTKLIAAMDYLLVGWVRWEAGKPVEHRMVRVVDGVSPVRRSELGDDDETTWEKDLNGQLRDPWQLTQYLPAVDENGEVYTFSTTSRGGIGAIADLSRHYGNNRRVHADDFPVITLQVGSYQHQNPQFGRIKFPTFKREGWASKSTFWSAIGADEMMDAPQAEEVNLSREMDDSIPF
jgi:hypothetical protein